MTVVSEGLLESVRGLPNEELKEFTEQVLRLNAARQSPSLSASETEELKEIQRPLSAQTVARYRELAGKRDAGTLAEDEHRELCELSDLLEQRNAERLAHVANLARSRGVTLSNMIDQLGLGHLVDSQWPPSAKARRISFVGAQAVVASIAVARKLLQPSRIPLSTFVLVFTAAVTIQATSRLRVKAATISNMTKRRP
jgi:hypothetical protein